MPSETSEERSKMITAEFYTIPLGTVRLEGRPPGAGYSLESVDGGMFLKQISGTQTWVLSRPRHPGRAGFMGM